VELEGVGERVARRARPAPSALSLFLLLVPCCRSAKAFISFFRAVVFLVLNWMTVLSWWWWWGDGGNGRREERVKEEGQQRRAREWFSAATHAVPPRVKKKQRRAPFVPPRTELLPLPHPWELGQPQGGAMPGAHGQGRALRGQHAPPVLALPCLSIPARLLRTHLVLDFQGDEAGVLARQAALGGRSRAALWLDGGRVRGFVGHGDWR
jgi:hypothetical protein